MIHLTTCTFVHVPRTGGMWVESALKAAGVTIRDGKAGDHEVKSVEGPVFYFVRNPFDWMMSYWINRQRNNWNWEQGLELDETCMSKDFVQFLFNLSYNHGVVMRHLDHYVGIHRGNEKFIGRTENIARDLIKVLEHFNIPHNRNAILSHGPVNSQLGPKPIYNDMRRVFDPSHLEYFKKYGYDPHYGT